MYNTEEMLILCENAELSSHAEALSEKLHIPRTSELSKAVRNGLYLELSEEGLSLSDGDMDVKGDFSHLLPRLIKGRLNTEFLVKAAKIKGKDTLYVVDATAGLGEDSLILAAAGFTVRLYEKDPVIAALLEDALLRASQDPELQNIVSRMTLCTADSIEAMPSLSPSPDVILLDPMFPERHKTAAVKKKFQLIHHLEKPCEDEEALLNAAIAAKPRKILIKRPVKGPYLCGRKPSYSIAGKAVRYDCLVFPEN